MCSGPAQPADQPDWRSRRPAGEPGITAQRRKDSAESFLRECDWATVLPAPRIVNGFMTASFTWRGLGMDLQPDLTFEVWYVVPRPGDLWLPQAADTRGPQIRRWGDAAGGMPR